MFKILVATTNTYLDYLFDTREEADLVAYDHSRWFPKLRFAVVEV